MLRILSQEDRSRIHTEGKRIQEELGVKIHNATVYDLFCRQEPGLTGRSACLSSRKKP